MVENTAQQVDVDPAEETPGKVRTFLANNKRKLIAAGAIVAALGGSYVAGRVVNSNSGEVFEGEVADVTNLELVPSDDALASEA